MSCFTRPYTIHGQECKPRLVSWAPTKNRQDHYESSKRMIKGDDKKLVTIEDQFMNCTGMMVRSYNPSGHKYQKKLSSTRLDMIASDHRLPRIAISWGIRGRSQSRTRFGSNGNLIPDSVSSGLFRSLSVPDISSIPTEQFQYWSNRKFGYMQEDKANYLKTKTEMECGDQQQKLDDVMKWKEEFPSLVEKDREMELCEIVPHQLLVNNKMKVVKVVTFVYK